MKKQRNQTIKENSYIKNKFNLLEECKNSSIQNHKFQTQSGNKPRIKQIFNEKSVNINVSISDINQALMRLSQRRKSGRFDKMAEKQNSFGQFFMKQENRFSFSGHFFKNNSDKENVMGLGNQIQEDYKGFAKNSLIQRSKKVEQLQQILDQTYIKVKNTYESIEKQQSANNTTYKFHTTPRLQLINKLISMLQTNKNIRVRAMFEERQLISQQQQQEKKQEIKKLQRINEIADKVKNRKMSETIAVQEISDLFNA